MSVPHPSGSKGGRTGGGSHSGCWLPFPGQSSPCGLLGSDPAPLVIPEGPGSVNTLDYRVFEEVGKPVAEMPTPWPLLVNGRDYLAFCWVTVGEAGERSPFHWEFQSVSLLSPRWTHV